MAGCDAAVRTCFQAKLVFCTGIGDYVRHCFPRLINLRRTSFRLYAIYEKVFLTYRDYHHRRL
jgi:hypothetical protein